MNALIHHPRRALALGIAIAIALLALLPGSWAQAQTGTAGAPSPTVVTNPDGSTTTTTTADDGTTTTVTESSTGVLTTVVGPGGQPVTTVQVKNPNAPATLSAFRLNMTFQIAPGTLTAAEKIQVVEQLVEDIAQAFGLDVSQIVITLTEASAALVVETDAHQTSFQRQDAEEALTVRAVKIFELDLVKEDGSLGQPGQPVRITWDATPEELSEARGDVDNLLMIGFNEATRTWTPAARVGQTSNSVTFELPHFSIWAFAIRNTPAPSAPTPADTGMGATEFGASNTLAIVLSIVALAGILGAGSRVVLGRRRA